jgi:hypothetical protein
MIAMHIKFNISKLGNVQEFYYQFIVQWLRKDYFLTNGNSLLSIIIS